MEHFLKKTTSVTSSMNQSGGSSSDIKSPPLLITQKLAGANATNSISQGEQRATSLFPSSYRPQMTSSTSATCNLTTPATSLSTCNNTPGSAKETAYITESVKKGLNSDSTFRNRQQVISNNSSTTKEKEYTEIECIAVPKLSPPQFKQGNRSKNVGGEKNEDLNSDLPAKSSHSSDDEDESSATTSTDSFSDCSDSSNECAKIDFEEEGGADDEDEGKLKCFIKKI